MVGRISSVEKNVIQLHEGNNTKSMKRPYSQSRFVEMYILYSINSVPGIHLHLYFLRFHIKLSSRRVLRCPGYFIIYKDHSPCCQTFLGLKCEIRGSILFVKVIA